MSVPVPPAPGVAGPAPRRRPVAVTLAAVVLALMGVGGLVYAVATLLVAPGTVRRFRAAASGSAATEVDNFVTVVWIGAAVALVLAVVLVALYVVLALSLRRGSNAARIGTLVVCGLGLLAGCGSMVTVLVQRSGDPATGTLGAALSGAYPESWIGLNVALAVAQMVGYALVAILLLAGRGDFFGRGGVPAPAPQAAGLPRYGEHNPWATTVPPVAPQRGPDDDYWSRPSS